MARSVLSMTALSEHLALHRAWIEAGAPEAQPFVADRLTLFDTILEPSDVSNISFVSVRLIRSDLSGSTFYKCDFSGAMLTECCLRRTRFIDCTFRKSELMDADAREASFMGSSMTRADFSNADLRLADFTSCDLGWSWLTKADLRHATLENANLDGARLVGTHLFSDRRFRLNATERTLVQEVTLDVEAAGPAVSGLNELDAIRIIS